jgi:hypothetical protein
MVLLACAFALPAGYARADTPPELPPEASGRILEHPEQPTTPDRSVPAAVPPEEVVAPQEVVEPQEAVETHEVVEPQDPASDVTAEGGGAQPDAPQPALQAERDPQTEPGTAPAPDAAPDTASTPPPAADVPNRIPAPVAPAQVPDPQAGVGPIPAPALGKEETAHPGSRLLAEIDTRLRRVKRRVSRVKSEVDAGRAPADSSLRALRHDVAGLALAVAQLERHIASHPSHELDTARVERGLQRARAAAAALVAALARMGVDTLESGRLTSVLERFAGGSATVRVQGRARAGHGAPGPAGAADPADPQLAYTHSAAASAQSRSGIARENPDPAATAGWPRRLWRLATGPASLAQLAATPAASTAFSTLGLAALALLLALAASASLSSFLLSGWGLSTPMAAPAPHRRTTRRPTRAWASRGSGSQKLPTD